MVQTFNLNNGGQQATNALRPVTFLHVAIGLRLWGVVQCLIENGANLNQPCAILTNTAPFTPLQFFLHRQATNPDKNQLQPLLEFFLKKEGDFTVSVPGSNSNMAILCEAAESIRLPFFMALQRKIGKEKFRACVDSPAVLPPLHILCNKGLAAHVAFFLANGIDPNPVNDMTTPLSLSLIFLAKLKIFPPTETVAQHALTLSAQNPLLSDFLSHLPPTETIQGCIERYEEIKDALLQHLGEKKHMRCYRGGRNLLHCVVELQHEQFTQELCERGFNVDAQNDEGETPAYKAVELNNLSLLRLLAERFNCNLSLGKIPLIVNIESDLNNVKIIKNSTPLVGQAKKTQEEAVRKELKLIAANDENITSLYVPPSVIITPLIFAIASGCDAITRYLLPRLTENDLKNFNVFIAAAVPQLSSRTRPIFEAIPELRRFLHGLFRYWLTKMNHSIFRYFENEKILLLKIHKNTDFPYL